MFNTTQNTGMPWGYPQGAMMYNPQQQPMQKQMNNLTPEEIQRLAKKDGQFSLRITETDALKASCNHRTADGMNDSLVIDPIDGKLRCVICGHKFNTIDPTTTKEQIEEACEMVTDILQTTKLLYINMPAEAAREYYQIIPLIEKIPELFTIAVQNYEKHQNASGWQNYGKNGYGTAQLYQMLNGGMMGGMGMQPMGGYYQQPMQQFTSYDPVMGVQQPMQQPVYQAPGMMQAPVGAVAPQANAFGNFGGVQQGYVPGTQQFQYQTPPQVAPAAQVPYQMTAPQVQPGVTTPTETTATTDGATVTATANLKA